MNTGSSSARTDSGTPICDANSERGSGRHCQSRTGASQGGPDTSWTARWAHSSGQSGVGQCEGRKRIAIIFHGIDHYISPRWYRSGQADGKPVPTWDYAVVHARGPIEWIEDKSWLQALLEDMAKAFERGENPWRTKEMRTDYRESMLGRIVGFQIPISVLQGKFKLNQGSTPEDRAGVIAELKRLGTDSAMAMAEAIERAKVNDR